MIFVVHFSHYAKQKAFPDSTSFISLAHVGDYARITARRIGRGESFAVCGCGDMAYGTTLMRTFHDLSILEPFKSMTATTALTEVHNITLETCIALV